LGAEPVIGINHETTGLVVGPSTALRGELDAGFATEVRAAIGPNVLVGQQVLDNDGQTMARAPILAHFDMALSWGAQ
jgi:hypothetical protein